MKGVRRNGKNKGQKAVCWSMPFQYILGGGREELKLLSNVFILEMATMKTGYKSMKRNRQGSEVMGCGTRETTFRVLLQHS